MENIFKKISERVSEEVKIGSKVRVKINSLEEVINFASSVAKKCGLVFSKSDISGNGTFVTSNYSIFTIMHSNRDINVNRMEKLKKSVANVGWIPVPIVVNEYFEIIDGQHRFEVCKFLNIPIDFIMIKGLTIEDCIILNTNGSTWNSIDYLSCYQKQGYEHYVRFFEFAKQFPDLTYSDIFCIYENKIVANQYYPIGTKEGTIEFTEDRANEIKDACEFVQKHYNVFHSMNGTTKVGVRAFAWLYMFGGCDNSILETMLTNTKYSSNVALTETIGCVMQNISNVYNDISCKLDPKGYIPVDFRNAFKCDSAERRKIKRSQLVSANA